jgi:hypothetical protein
MVPDLSIEMDNLGEALSHVWKVGLALEYGPIAEPWGGQVVIAHQLLEHDYDPSVDAIGLQAAQALGL